MFFELLLLRQNKSNEKFTEEKSTNRTYDNIVLLFAIIYLIIMLILWIRVIVSAFQCGAMEGFSSILFPSLYTLFKFGDLIKLSCNRLY